MNNENVYVVTTADELAKDVKENNVLMEEYEKNPNFLDGQFYFHEIDIFQGEY